MLSSTINCRLLSIVRRASTATVAVLFILLLPHLSLSQDLTPLDSLYAGDSLGTGKRLLLKPIQWWQHLSYDNPSMNCQFEKSCSNFMVQAIQEKGVLPGLVVGTDRIIRCNPAARHYHIQRPGAQIQWDGRLVEPLDWEPDYHPKKNPALASALSIVPGLGRTYAGHPWDGLFSFVIVGALAVSTYQYHEADNPFMTGIQGGLTLLFWSADIYGAYRTASLAPPKNFTYHP